MIHYYIYGLYLDNKIIYVGRSFSPYVRQLWHKNKGNKFDYCKILDKERDLEQEWILKSLSEGALLLNKVKIPHTEEWNIGDIVYFKN